MEPITWLVIFIVVVGTITGIWLGSELDKMYEKVDEENQLKDEKAQEEINEQMDAYEIHMKVWHNNAGDPIILLHPDFPITYYRQYPDQMHWDNVCWFTFEGNREFCSRNMIGTLTLFHDTNNDRRLTNGEEMFWSITENAYAVAARHDTDGNGSLDVEDDSWDNLYVTDFLNTWPLGKFYTSVSLTPDETFEADCFGPGIYANPDTYVKDWAYYECLDSGKLDHIKYVLEDDIRITGYIKGGATAVNNEIHMTISAVQGYWYKK